MKKVTFEELKIKEHHIARTSISNKTLNDPNLSFSALGIFCRLMSLPKCNIDASELAKNSTDTESTVIAGIRELEKSGYLELKL
jgi:DNA-binding MarR family transcriptional regulator